MNIFVVCVTKFTTRFQPLPCTKRQRRGEDDAKDQSYSFASLCKHSESLRCIFPKIAFSDCEAMRVFARVEGISPADA